MPPKRNRGNHSDVEVPEPAIPSDATALSKEKIAHCLELLFQEIDKSVESRCSIIMNAAEESVSAMRNEYSIQLLTLNKKVRNMPLRDFMDQYGGSLNAMVSEDINRRMATHLNSGIFTPAVSRDNSVSEGPARTVLRTRTKKKTGSITGPAAAAGIPPDSTAAAATAVEGSEDAAPLQLGGPMTAVKPPGTAVRPIRKGEVLYSANGSPLAQAALASDDMDVEPPTSTDRTLAGLDAGAPAAPSHLPMVTPMVGAGGRTRGLTRATALRAADANVAGGQVPAPGAAFLLTTAAPGKRRKGRTNAAAGGEGENEAPQLEVRRPDGQLVSLEQAPEDVRAALQKVTSFLAQQTAALMQ